MAMLNTCLLLFIIFSMGNAEENVKGQDAAGLSSRCPATWRQYGLRCFKYISHPANWITAERNCQSLGANLASVHDKLENTFLLAILPSSTRTWVGANDAVQEGRWLWSDGSVFLYTRWCSKEPSNYRGGEHCLEINYSSDRCWNDASCSTLLPSVCVKDL